MFKLSLALSGVSLALGAAADLQTYCDLLSTKCGGQGGVFALNSSNCVVAMGNTMPGDDTDGEVDTIGCRLKYLQNNFTAASCRYAGPSGGGRCGNMVSSTCRIATHVCEGVSGASYTNATVCEQEYAAQGLSAQWGTTQGSAAGTENSLECRLYHSYTSLLLPAGGHCGHFGADKATSPCKNAVPATAAHYCDLLEFNCDYSNTTIHQFTSKAQCLQVAAGYVGSTDAQSSNNGNNLGCRVYHAVAAKVLGVDHCGHAGPTGGGQCGTPLQAWGSLLNAAPCSDKTVQEVVKSVDPALLDAAVPGGYRTTGVAYTPELDQGGNTQACRIYHLTVASAGGATADTHCPHGTLGGGGACGSNLASNLCKVIEKACTFGADASYQFADMTACTTALTNLTMGDWKADVDKNTYACRFYHAGVAASFLAGGANNNATGAVASNKLHCSHIIKMPTAAGGCGSTTSLAPTPKTSSASTLSAVVATITVATSVFSLW